VNGLPSSYSIFISRLAFFAFFIFFIYCLKRGVLASIWFVHFFSLIHWFHVYNEYEYVWGWCFVGISSPRLLILSSSTSPTLYRICLWVRAHMFVLPFRWFRCFVVLSVAFMDNRTDKLLYLRIISTGVGGFIFLPLIGWCVDQACTLWLLLLCDLTDKLMDRGREVDLESNRSK
jgi:hypothetical protein